MKMAQDDIELAKALMPDLSMNVIAEKFEVSLYDLAYSTLECDFSMPQSMFMLRLKRGTVRLTMMDIERKCVRCKEYLPFTHEFWHKANRNKDGAHSMCRACELERKVDVRANHRKQRVLN